MQDLGISILFKGTNLLRMLGGLWITIRISLLAALISIPLGILFGMFMTIKNPITKAISWLYLQFIRIMPQLVLLFIFFYGIATTVGWNWPAEFTAVFVFILWGTAEMGDLVRGALISIPRHQYESAEALGMTKLQTYQYIIIPQTLRRLIPLTINLVTRMIKTTSLVVLIGITEVMKVGMQIIDANRFEFPSGALWIYGVIFFFYFFTCWPISMLARWLEKRWKD